MVHVPEPDSAETRLSLLARARQKDSSAWVELVELYEPLIASWCKRCNLDAQTASDCVQETLLAVSQAIHHFEPRRLSGSFRAWLWTITSNKIRDVLRRQAHQVAGEGGSSALGRLQNVSDPSSIPEEEPTTSEAHRDLVARGLKQVEIEFEERTWRIFLRSVVDQLPTSQVAKEFGILDGTVRQIRSRVLRRLREQLGDID